MNNLFRAFRYIKLHLFNNPRYLFFYGLHFFDPNYTFKANFYSREDFAHLVEEGKTVIRLGDGEVHLMNRGDLGFQEYNPILREKMLSMIRAYNDSCQYILGFNIIPLESPNSALRKINLLNSWLPSKVYFDLYFNKKAKYVDASVFYYNEVIPKYLEKFLLSKHLIVVSRSGNISAFKDNSSIPFRDVSFIETLDEHAFRDYSQIKEKVLQEVEKYGKDKALVLVSCGPAGKVLAYDLLGQVQVLDIGFGIEIVYSDKKIDYIANPFLVRK